MRRVWQPHRDERIFLYSPIGLRLIDDFTGEDPISAIEPTLQIRVGNEWLHADESGSVFNGIVAYPGLGRTTNPGNTGLHRYRVKLKANLYKPIYEAKFDAIEFNVHPYNDRHPPGTVQTNAHETLLLPRTSYPFPTHMRVLHGRVIDAGGRPMSNVTVREGQRERVLTETNGSFSLPIRQPAKNAVVAIQAIDQRTNRQTLKQVQLPDALATNLDITIN